VNIQYASTRMRKGEPTMRKPISSFLFLILSASLLFAFSKPVMADDDPPGRVARLNYIQGSVSFQPGGETDWVQANPNRPLTTGDNLWTDRNSRGELHIGSMAIRLSAETGISFLNLNDRTVQIQLAQGSLSIHVRRLDGGDAFEIDTPNLAFTLQRPGEYRVDVDPDGHATIITVRQGEGEATGGGNNFHLDSGDRTSFSGTDSLSYDEGQAGRPDEFDEWCRLRDEREERAQSARYVSRDVIGYEDLDENGDWRSVPEYGYVWFPARVAVGWAPYRFGHWTWIAPWGWTWVEDEPWGFAPFHYGRWAVVGGGWCWVPGPVVVRPVYAPALVAFVGGGRFSMSLSIGGRGGVGWFPLGPREVYVPSYRSSVRYVQNVNITNTTVNVVNVTNVYNNVNVTKVTYMHQNNVAAVTAVSHETFVNARSVGAAQVRVNSQQLQTAEIQRGASMAPVRRSIAGAGEPATARPPAEVMRRQVIAKEQPAAPRVPFERSQQGPSLQPGRAPMQSQAQQPQTNRQPQSQQRPAQQQPQIQQRQQQQQTQQQRPQTDQTRRAPEQQNPAVKFAPPARANEGTYHPHEFERPRNAAPSRNEREQQKAPERGQPRGQESNKAGGDQNRK
jgi:hypothetical protein